MKRLAILLAAMSATVAAQAKEASLDFAGHAWRVDAKDAVVTSHLGKEALRLTRGRVWLDGARFSDGVIEFDLAYNEAQTFIGLMWRAESDERYEDIYVRAHLNGKPDAFQYTPTENGLGAWQIFSDGNAQAAVEEKYGAWNHVKLVAIGDAAEVYFNSDKPVLHVPDLKTDIKEGRLGLWALSLSGDAAYVSNFAYRPLREGDKLVAAPIETSPLPPGLISQWSVSSPFGEANVADTLRLGADARKDLTWGTLKVESNGIANLARLSGVSEGADTAFVRLRVRSDSAQMKELRFGYSDRVRIYLNGKRVYFGDAGWRARDYRFLGTVGFFDTVGLDLRKGDNELLIAVSETFGGWAWAGAIADQAGISLE